MHFKCNLNPSLAVLYQSFQKTGFDQNIRIKNCAIEGWPLLVDPAPDPRRGEAGLQHAEQTDGQNIFKVQNHKKPRDSDF